MKFSIQTIVLLAMFSVGAHGQQITFTAKPGFNPWTIPPCLTNKYYLQNLFPIQGVNTIEDRVYSWRLVGWLGDVSDGGFWQDYTTGNFSSEQFPPGTGIVYFNSSSNSKSFTFTLVTNVSSLPAVRSNFYDFRGASSGLPATYEQVFGGPPREETALFRIIPGANPLQLNASNYRIYYFKNGAWSPETPILDPYEPVRTVYPYLSIKPTRTPASGSLLLQLPRGWIEEADSPDGPWRDLDTVTNQFSVQPSTNGGGRKFYRAREGRFYE